MSIPVELEALHARVIEYGSSPLLLSVGDNGRPHAVSVAVSWVDGAMTAQSGGKTNRNCAARSNVALVFPAIESGGYLLIVDAVAAVSDETITLVPERAVLHRNAAEARPDAGADAGGAVDGCGNDCVTVLDG